MKKEEMKKLMAEAARVRGSRRVRYIGELEINKMVELDRKRSLQGKTIRVYSFDGFVPNNYRWPAPIDYIYREYDETGNAIFGTNQTDAKRSRAVGSLITVNGRAL